MKNIKTFLTEMVPSSRALNIGMWSFVFLLNISIGWHSTDPNFAWVNFLCAGFALASGAFSIVQPALFDTASEARKAQVERDIRAAFSEFQKDHPEIQIGPLEGPFRQQ